MRNIIIDAILPLCMIFIGTEAVTRHQLCIWSHCIDFSFIGVIEGYAFIAIGIIYFLIKRRKRILREEKGGSEEEPFDTSRFS